jgi:FMN reductase [NAD(P)H]
VHRDRYDDNAVTVVKAYDRRRDARHSIKDRQKSPEVFGTAEFYGWSEDKARQAMSAEGGSFAAWLRERGFDLTK